MCVCVRERARERDWERGRQGKADIQGVYVSARTYLPNYFNIAFAPRPLSLFLLSCRHISMIMSNLIFHFWHLLLQGSKLNSDQHGIEWWKLDSKTVADTHKHTYPHSPAHWHALIHSRTHTHTHGHKHTHPPTHSYIHWLTHRQTKSLSHTHLERFCYGLCVIFTETVYNACVSFSSSNSLRDTLYQLVPCLLLTHRVQQIGCKLYNRNMELKINESSCSLNRLVGRHVVSPNQWKGDTHRQTPRYTRHTRVQMTTITLTCTCILSLSHIQSHTITYTHIT